MTREQAIERLEKLREVVENFTTDECLKMAINALQTEPCEDAISRAEAMNVLDALYLDGESAQGFTADANEDCLIGKYKAIEILEELPSVQPEQRTGKWIHHGDYDAIECSLCGAAFPDELSANYCPNCGAKMEAE